MEAISSPLILASTGKRWAVSLVVQPKNKFFFALLFPNNVVIFITLFFCYLSSFFASLLLELSTVQGSLTSKWQAMKKQHILQEVLVSTRTTLSVKALFETNDFNKEATPVEKFEEACWNGLFNEIFSEILPHDSDQFKKIFIWEYMPVNRICLLTLQMLPVPLSPGFV